MKQNFYTSDRSQAGQDLSKATPLSVLVSNFKNNAVRSDDLASLVGAESLSLNNNYAALSNKPETSLDRRLYSEVVGRCLEGDKFKQDAEREIKALGEYYGAEAFSNTLSVGDIARSKAATVELATSNDKQLPAAELAYPTVKVPYNMDVFSLPIEVPGIGTFRQGNNSNDSFEQMRPIATTLTDSSFTTGDDLVLIPVYNDDPSDDANVNADKFVDSAKWTPWDHVYETDDVLGRRNHLTNFIKVGRIPNIMSTMAGPGMKNWSEEDELDEGATAVKSLMIELKTSAGNGVFRFALADSSGNTLRPNADLNSKDSRSINWGSRRVEITELFDQQKKNEAALALFKPLTDKGLRVFLDVQLDVKYSRNTREWVSSVSPIAIHHVVNEQGVKMAPGASNTPKEITALIRGLKLEGTVGGLEVNSQHANTNWSRQGMTIRFGTAKRDFNITRRTPLAFHYTHDEKDTNQTYLKKAIDKVSFINKRNKTHDAFRALHAHFEKLLPLNGQTNMDINDDSNNIMPGMYFLNVTAIRTEIDFLNSVLVRESTNVLEGVRAVLQNKLQDIITAIQVRSNVAAMKEIDGRKEEYVILLHTAFAPYIMEAGDFRTFGDKERIDFKVETTNVDTMLDKIYVFPKSETSDNYIDVFGGVGFLLEKEMTVIDCPVHNRTEQLRQVVSLPQYTHHSTGVIMAQINLKNAAELLSGEGILSNITKYMVKVSGSVEGIGGGNTTDPEVTIPGDDD